VKFAEKAQRHEKNKFRKYKYLVCFLNSVIKRKAFATLLPVAIGISGKKMSGICGN
jgi:hypothetical protein